MTSGVLSAHRDFVSEALELIRSHQASEAGTKNKNSFFSLLYKNPGNISEREHKQNKSFLSYLRAGDRQEILR